MMGPIESFGHGFADFFSIWQACILQVSPFFIAYVTGLYFAVRGERSPAGIGRRMLLPTLFFSAGFAVFYALLTLGSLPVGRILSYNLGTLGFLSGLYILLVGLALLLHGRVAFVGYLLERPLVLGAISLLLGISFALVYSPCISPALSEIMNITSHAKTAVRGGFLALFYALGICLALGVTVVALTLILKRSEVITRNSGRVKDGCALVLAVLGVLNVTGLMVYYKASLLGFLVK